MKIGFAEIPPIGLAVAINGQRFDLMAVEDYTRLDGTPTNLLVWNSDCAECGAPFITKSGSKSLPGVRRCKPHAQPGRKVKS